MDHPLWTRFAFATAWSVAYWLVAWFGIWRPLNPWVSVVIVAAIFAGHLPPRSIRPFVSGLAFLVVAGVLVVVVNSTLLGILAGVYGAISIIQGVSARSVASRGEQPPG